VACRWSATSRTCGWIRLPVWVCTRALSISIQRDPVGGSSRRRSSRRARRILIQAAAAAAATTATTATTATAGVARCFKRPSGPEAVIRWVSLPTRTPRLGAHSRFARSLTRSFAHSPVLDVPVHGRVLGRRRRSGVSERRGPGAGRRAPSVRSAGHVPDMAEAANGWRSRSRSRSTRWCHRDDVLERERENRKRPRVIWMCLPNLS
jgi:hypothetical protein